jgi:superfamily II DNA or RNA helicase
MAAATSLSSKGYGILKTALEEGELDHLRKSMTVKPFNNAQQLPQNNNNDEGFPVYSESSTRIYLPKAYGLAEYGLPEVTKLNEGEDISIEFNGSLRPEQSEPVDAYMKAARDPARMGGIINLVCGQGKCLGWDTPVIMYNGDVKMVQDVRVGDTLMGDDSTVRMVVSTCTGREKMYRVVNRLDGTCYTVNKSHIISLVNKTTLQKSDITISEYIGLSNQDREDFYGYKAPVDHFHAFTCNTTFPSFMSGCRHNQRDVNETAPHVPLVYMLASKEVRFAYLRGLAASCGDRTLKPGYLTFLTKVATNQIKFMAQSLGLFTYKFKGYICLSAHMFDKMAQGGGGNFRIGIEDCMFPIDVVELEENNYYGFELQGTNRRFLLGDFTVTHNTVCALYIIATLKKKALIVVHKDFLLNQWKERIDQFLPSAKVGLIKAKTCDIEGKDVVIGSLQSLSMKTYDATVFDGFGLICVDECHRTGAEVFSRVYKRINVRYSLGLSATVNRKDGLSKVFKWHIGGIVYKGSKRKDVVQIFIDNFDHPSEMYCKEVLMYNGSVNMSRMINNICDFQPRVEYLVNRIREILAKEPKRKVLVLSDRRKHLEAIKSCLDGSNDEITSGFYYGGMKPSELKVSEEQQVLLATYAFCAEGLDVPKLDTLILGSPKSDIIQSLGRILREKERDRLHVPMVIDIVDSFSIFPSQAGKRMKYYKAQKYDVHGTNHSSRNKKQEIANFQGVCAIEEHA